jgi:DNA-3-methyladenine glycosylase
LPKNNLHAGLNKLPKKFYERYVLDVAPDLLGKIFVRKAGDTYLSGKIVETEAYDGAIDEAAHSYNGRTERNAVMFDGTGLLYVYFTYGMHYCANVVTGKIGHGQAVLLRGIEPLKGIDQMSLNRFGNSEPDQRQKLNLTNGPAKICQAFKISKQQYGTDLTGSEIYILDEPLPPGSKIISTTRIGIKKSVNFPWRFLIKDNIYVSKHNLN